MNYALELAIYLAVGGLSLATMTTLVAVPLALITLAVDRVAGKWMTARVRCWLWIFVAVRLVLPVAPESSVSAIQMWHLINWSEQAASVDHAPSDTSNLLAQEPPEGSMATGPAGVPAQRSMVDILVEGRENILPDLAAVATGPHTSSDLLSATTRRGWEEVLGIGLASSWLLGVTFVLLRASIASLRFMWRLHRIPEVDDPSTINVVLQVCDQIGVRRPRVKLVPELPTPALFGVWQPTLCLPEDSQHNLGNDQLRMIALHEAMHIRRNDGYLAWLLTIVRAIHWINPVAWFAIKQIETYRELACDDAVRKFTRPQEYESYANLLLQYASCRPAASLGLLGLCFARPAKGKGLARRIKAFTVKKEEPKRLPRAVSVMMLLLMAVVGLTDAASTRIAEVAEQPKMTIFSVSEPSAWDALPSRLRGQLNESDPDKVETREYDLTEALAKADDVPPNMTAKDWLLSWGNHRTSQPPVISPIEGDSNRVSISMSRSGHDFFEQMLAEVCRVGHVGQVVVTTRIMSSKHVEQLIDTDWVDTIKYAAPEPISSSQWAESVSHEEGQELSLSMEAVSFEYAPYTAFIIDSNKMGKLVRYIANDEKSSIINAPKVTLFSGQSALISDQSYAPFIYGVESIKGEHATALQPNITVVPEGLQIDLQALALDDDTVDLRCRLTLSSIDGVTQATLPGAEITVQTPKTTRRTVNVCCQLERGKTLLVAPLAGQRSDGKKTHYYAISAKQIFPEAQGHER